MLHPLPLFPLLPLLPTPYSLPLSTVLGKVTEHITNKQTNQKRPDLTCLHEMVPSFLHLTDKVRVGDILRQHWEIPKNLKY